MTFGEAIAHIKANPEHVATREGWNGKGQWIAHVFGSSGTVGHKHVSFEPFLVLMNAQGKLIPWLASQGDALSTDWTLLNAAP